MSFVSTNNKSGIGGLTTTTPPITGESGGVPQIQSPEAWQMRRKPPWNRLRDRCLAHCRSHQDW